MYVPYLYFVKESEREHETKKVPVTIVFLVYLTSKYSFRSFHTRTCFWPSLYDQTVRIAIPASERGHYIITNPPIYSCTYMYIYIYMYRLVQWVFRPLIASHELYKSPNNDRRLKVTGRHVRGETTGKELGTHRRLRRRGYFPPCTYCFVIPMYPSISLLLSYLPRR